MNFKIKTMSQFKIFSTFIAFAGPLFLQAQLLPYEQRCAARENFNPTYSQLIKEKPNTVTEVLPNILPKTVTVSVPGLGLVNPDTAVISYYENMTAAQAGTKKTILILHGNASSSRSMLRLFRSQLSTNYRLVALDLPGFGESDRLNGYNAGIISQIMNRAAKQVGADNSIILAWSLGSDIAYQMLSVTDPNEKIDAKGLFVFGSAPVLKTVPVPFPYLLPTDPCAFALGFAYLFQPLPYTPLQAHQLTEAFFNPEPEPVVPQFFVEDALASHSVARIAVTLAAAGVDTTFVNEVDTLRNLQIPVAIIHARRDRLVRLAYLENILQYGLPPTLWRNKIQLLNRTGHAAQFERTSQIAELFEQFVNETGIQ